MQGLDLEALGFILRSLGPQLLPLRRPPPDAATPPASRYMRSALCTRAYDKYSGTAEIATHLWIRLVTVKQHLVHTGRIDGPSEYSSWILPAMKSLPRSFTLTVMDISLEGSSTQTATRLGLEEHADRREAWQRGSERKVKSAGSKVQGVGCRMSGRLYGVECRVSDVGCRVSGVRCRVSGAGCRVSGVGCQVSGVKLLVHGVGCRVSSAGGGGCLVKGLGCRV